MLLLHIVAFLATYGNAGTTCNDAAAKNNPDTWTAPTMNTDKSKALELPTDGNYDPNAGTRTRIKESDLIDIIPKPSDDIVHEGVTWLHEYGGTCTCPSGATYQVSTYSFQYGRCGKFACKNGEAGACNKRKGEWSYRSVTCASKRKHNPNAQGFNNIGNLFDGYNILLGNPLPFQPDLLDPGFTNQIFQNTKNQDRQTMDHRFMVPDDVDAENCENSCSLSMTAQVLRTDANYHNTLKDSVQWDTSVGASVKFAPFSAGFSAAFSGSDDYQTINKGFTQEQSQYVMSTATCCSYNFKHQDGGSSSVLEKGFVDAVWKLPPEYDENAYSQFVDRYGTHYVKEVTMGSKYAEIYRISTADMRKMEASHTNVQHAAEVKACAAFAGIASIHAGAGYGSSHSTSNDNQNGFQHQISDRHVVSLGALPPKGASDVRAWTKSVVNNPQPIAVKLGDISFVLSDTFVESYMMNPEDLKKRKANLEKYILTYCQRMKKSGQLAKYAQCPCSDIECCNSRDDSNVCDLLSPDDFCRKSGVCTDSKCVIYRNQKFNPIDYGVNGRTVTKDAKECSYRCETTSDCIGSSWWSDGGCHLVTDGAELEYKSGVTSYRCLRPKRTPRSPVRIQTPAPVVATEPPRSNFALVDGGPGSDKRLQPYWNPDPNQKLGEVQCCKDGQCTRRNPWNSRRNRNCISGNRDSSKFTLQEAKDMCASLGWGWTLCTRWEVENKKCNKKGCNHDSQYVWVLERPEQGPCQQAQGDNHCCGSDGWCWGGGHDGSYWCHLNGANCATCGGQYMNKKVTCVGTQAEHAVADEENSMKNESAVGWNAVAEVEAVKYEEKIGSGGYSPGDIILRTCAPDQCLGKWDNAIPTGEQWEFVREYSSFGCCMILTLPCYTCMKPIPKTSRCGTSRADAEENCGNQDCNGNYFCWDTSQSCYTDVKVCTGSGEASESGRSTMAYSIMGDNAQIAIGIFAVIGACAIMYTLAQRARKFASDPEWEPIAEADI